jgi:uncharacterized membrane protein YhaH (DUF805 family)
MSSFFKTYFTGITFGTMSRKQYWLFVLYCAVYGTIAGIVYAVFTKPRTEEDIMIGIIVVMIPIMWPSIVSLVKRTRDLGISGWWYFITIIPYIGTILSLVITLLPTNYFLRFKKQEVVTA